MDKKSILIVEDSKRLNDFLKTQLEKNRYSVIQAINGREAYEALKSNSFDLIILDLNLGDINGMKILKTIRLQDKKIPVMIISSINDDATKIEGFKIGCDDYLTKPFMSNELIMRIRRMIERSELMNISQMPIQETIKSGQFKVDIPRHSIYKNGVEIPMRKKYFDIFLYFVKHPNIAIPYKTLYESVWDSSSIEDSVLKSNLYVNIDSLRKLIEDDPKNPQIIQSIRHVGYLYNVEESFSFS